MIIFYMIFILHTQRNHSLFGTVWSSIRRRGQGAFTRKMQKSQGNNIGQDGQQLSLSSDPLYHTMQRSVAEGMNHITKSILQSHVGGSGSLGYDSLHGSRELQTRGDAMPMRPLTFTNGGSIVHPRPQ